MLGHRCSTSVELTMGSAANFVFYASWFSVFFFWDAGEYSIWTKEIEIMCKKKIPQENTRWLQRGQQWVIARPFPVSWMVKTTSQEAPILVAIICTAHKNSYSYYLKLIVPKDRSSWDQVLCEIVPVIMYGVYGGLLLWTCDHSVLFAC